MTQEEKELLIKDLCGRLPYHVKIHSWYGEPTVSDLNTFPFSTELMYEEDMWDQLSGFKPYLRPMSSMTEEEDMFFWCLNHNPNTGVDFMTHAPELIDWLHEHHFDYRGLIDRGLALEAPEGMYND